MPHLYLSRLITLLFAFATSAVVFAQVPAGGVARLSGQQEVLPVVTTGTGSVNVTFTEADNDMLEVVVTGSFEGLSSPVATSIRNGAHIHMAYPGRNGSIVLELAPQVDEDGLGGTFPEAQNTFMVPAADFAGAAPGMLYVNIHTQAYPMGEIRGTIVGAETEHFYANLFGSNEVPSRLSQASGAVVLQLDDENTLTVAGSFMGLSDTLSTSIGGGAHLHIGLPGRNGDVDIPLAATTQDDDTSGVFTVAMNSFELTEDQAEALRSGRYYANIHSGAFPSGEIRGQVLPPADLLFRAHLSGSNEWPVVTTGASGQVLAHVAGNTLRLIGSFADLSAEVATSIGGGAHLHPGYAGQNGPVAVPLAPSLEEGNTSGTFAIAENTYELTDDQFEMMLDRGIYLNIHSTAHPAGEIRGQVLPESQAVFTAFLNGNQQIPSVTTAGRGLVKVELLGERMTVTGSFQGLMSDLNTAISGGSHLHAGYPGQSGPVIYPLAATQEGGDTAGVYLPADNTFLIGMGGVDTLMRRFFYTNIHSIEYPNGEIRGSVLAEAESYFLAPLSGASQPVGVPTQATGMLAVEVVDTNLTLVGSFSDLESDFAANVAGGMHLHQAIAGRNGDIIQAINTEIMEDMRSGEIHADSNRVTLSATNYDLMAQRRVYANVHTVDYRAGAIRGQVLPLAGSYFHTTFSGANATNYVMTTAEGGLKLELIDTTLRVSGAVSMLEGDYDASIRNGAHLHLAAAGTNGPIQIPLNPTVDEDLKGARFFVNNNTFPLSDTLLMALRDGLLYANVHTTTVPSGEARGQVRSELNLPPMATEILSPADGDSLALAGANTQAFRVTYAPTTDPDMDTVIYVWQLATDADFANVIFGANTGRDTFFETNFGTVATLLDSNAVSTDSTITLYHRVLASDGSNFTPGEGAALTLARDTIVGTRNVLPLDFAARVFPNPTTGTQDMNFEISTGEAFTGRLYFYSAVGQLISETVVDAQVGTRNYALTTSTVPSGQYFAILRRADGQILHAARISVQ